VLRVFVRFRQRYTLEMDLAKKMMRSMGWKEGKLIFSSIGFEL
jgi:hypothetical protein